MSMGDKSRNYRALALHRQDGYDFLDAIIGGNLISDAVRETRPPVRTPWARYAKTLASRGEGLRVAAKRAEAWPGDWAVDENASRSLVSSKCDSSPGVCDPLSCDYAACSARRMHTDLICSTCDGGPDRPTGGCTSGTTQGPESLKAGEDTTNHFTGDHHASVGLRGKCTYSNCSTLCSVRTTFTNVGESGWTYTVNHVGKEQTETRDSSSAVAGVAPGTCWAVYGYGVKACPFLYCNIEFQVVGLTMKSDGLWTFDHGLDFTCAAAGFGSPILVDVSGDGFNLTDLAGGVTFDLKRRGTAHRTSWTAASSDDAFLVLDRNGNGTIDDGGELFGDATDQPQSTDRNGFSALAEFDKSAKGGNGDGLIDSRDTVFGQLRLWRDANHNGVSESSELSTLSSASLTAVELDYKESKKKDAYGNQFRYRAKVRHAHDSVIARWAWDVFFVVE
ncbi:MAG TPA: hypothetical protein VN181_11625 [Thermoanaerobaculia bacterium]|nr:hypothetical protein [Thermoanaerobaculia bacterium]